MIIGVISAIFSSLAFGVLFNVKGKKLLVAAIGGGVGWFFYLLTLNYSSNFNALFIASCSITIYSEIMARIYKTPVTTFLIASLIPLVPGNGMYYTMFEGITGKLDKAMNSGYQTLFSAGSIAIGIVLISSIVKLITASKYKNT